MTKNEWKSLADSLAGTWSASSSASPRSLGVDVESLVQSTNSLQSIVRDEKAVNEKPPRQSSSSSGSSGDGGGSAAGEVLKTIGLVTGVGPVVTGLIKLFGGGGGQSEPPPALTPYQMPERLSVEAGVLSDRSLSQLSYAQNGTARSVSSTATAGANAAQTASGATAGPQIQIQVNAMDSRSFMDHSDDIARAVRSAILRSNSVNDAISEL